MPNANNRKIPTFQVPLSEKSDFSHSLPVAVDRIIPVMKSGGLLKERVIDRLRELARSPIEAALKGGLERNYIDDLIKSKKTSFSQKYLPKVAAGLDWTVAQLLGEDKSNSPDILSRDDMSSVSIPEIDVRAGAGHGGGFGQEEHTTDSSGRVVATDSVRTSWGFPLPFLRDELHLRPGAAHILPIRGDSMIDVLYDGDRAVIDLDDQDVSQGGIFAVLDDNGSVIVKQVEFVRGKGPRRIRCTSRNPRYAPFDLLLDDPVRIIGRVACRITRI